jgi:hypothetical protein
MRFDANSSDKTDDRLVQTNRVTQLEAVYLIMGLHRPDFGLEGGRCGDSDGGNDGAGDVDVQVRPPEEEEAEEHQCEGQQVLTGVACWRQTYL